MSGTCHLHTIQLRAAQDKLRAGDRVLLSGTIFTARDAAHKRLFALLDAGKPLPFPLQDSVIYYAGPTPGAAEYGSWRLRSYDGQSDERFCPPLCWIWAWVL